jgi:hypothetical protein
MVLDFLSKFVSKDFALWIESIFLFIVIFSLGILLNKYVISFIRKILEKYSYL